MTKEFIIQSIKSRVEECMIQGEKHYNVTLPRPKRIVYKEKGTCGGYSNTYSMELMFQIDLMKQNFDEYMNVVIPHEVAHWVTDNVYGRDTQPHGREWKSVMINCYNLPPKRCHSMDTSTLKKRRVVKFNLNCVCGNTLRITKMMTKQIILSEQGMMNRHRVCGGCRTRLNTNMYEMSNEFIMFASTLMPVSGDMISNSTYSK